MTANGNSIISSSSRTARSPSYIPYILLANGVPQVLCTSTLLLLLLMMWKEYEGATTINTTTLYCCMIVLVPCVHSVRRVEIFEVTCGTSSLGTCGDYYPGSLHGGTTVFRDGSVATLRHARP